MAVAVEHEDGRARIGCRSCPHRRHRHEIVVGAGNAQHRTRDRFGIDGGGAGPVEHPEEQLEKGAARFRAEFVEHGALLAFRHAVHVKTRARSKSGLMTVFQNAPSPIKSWPSFFAASVCGRMPARGPGATSTSARASPFAARDWAGTAPMEWPRSTGSGGIVLRNASSSAR